MRRIPLLGVVAIVLSASLLLAASDRWIHVRVINRGQKDETVSINLPLELAEKVLPTIERGNLKDGKVRIRGRISGVDVHRLLEAVRTAGDNEFVSVKSAKENVRVAKSEGFLLVKVRESKGRPTDVDIKVPINVVDALFSSGNDELDLVAAVHALQNDGDTDLVTVHDETNNVHIWVDSRNTED